MMGGKNHPHPLLLENSYWRNKTRSHKTAMNSCKRQWWMGTSEHEQRAISIFMMLWDRNELELFMLNMV